MSTDQAVAESAHSAGVANQAASRVVRVPGAPGWHDEVYQTAQRDPAKVPWAAERPNPALVSWLNAEAPGRVRPGARAAVVGCGLGDDVIELQNRGYDAAGFDVSPTAIDWARHRFPQQAESFMVSDLFDLPSRLRRRFDLVVEVYTFQAVSLEQRAAAVAAVASLCCPHGTVVCVCRGRDDDQSLESFKGPPWPLSAKELVALFERAGMHPVREPDDFEDDATPPVRRVRAAFVHR